MDIGLDAGSVSAVVGRYPDETEMPASFCARGWDEQIGPSLGKGLGVDLVRGRRIQLANHDTSHNLRHVQSVDDRGRRAAHQLRQVAKRAGHDLQTDGAPQHMSENWTTQVVVLKCPFDGDLIARRYHADAGIGELAGKVVLQVSDLSQSAVANLSL